MLQSMRRLAHSWLSKGLFLILAASFGIWGIGDMFKGNPLRRTVAKAGNVTITVQELNREFSQDLARARQMLGPDLTAKQAAQMGMADSALNDLIENSLVDQDLQRLGIAADNETVMLDLSGNPHFKDKDGKFDKEMLRGFLADAHVSERTFFDKQRVQAATGQLVSAFSSLPAAPQTAADAVYKARAMQHVYDVLTVLEIALPQSDAPDDKMLQDFYHDNPQPFTAPESRGLTIAELSTDAMAKDTVISDDQVKAEYDKQGDRLAQPERRDLLQVVVQDEAKARELTAAARAPGSNLAVAAKKMGRQVVPLNGESESELPSELAKPAFALHHAEVSDPIQTPLGWNVLQLRMVTPPGVPKFEDIKDSLREQMQHDQAIDAASRLVNQLDDELAAGHTLEDIADGMKLRLIKIPAVDAAGKTPAGQDPAELPHKDDVLKAAFAQNSGETSPVMDDKNGGYFVVRTDSVTPSALKPFDQVKPEVLAAWMAKQKAQRAAGEAELIAKGLREGKPSTSFLTEPGVSRRQSMPVSVLNESDPSLPQSIMPRLLNMAKNEVVVIAQKDRQLVIRAASITPPAGGPDAPTNGKILSELGGDEPKELGEEYLKYLRTVFPVKIDHDAVAGVAAQGG